LKDKNDDSKGSFFKKNFDLHRIILNKASFSEMLSKNVKKGDSTQRVHGKFRVEFNLEEIFANL